MLNKTSHLSATIDKELYDTIEAERKKDNRKRSNAVETLLIKGRAYDDLKAEYDKAVAQLEKVKRKGKC